MTQYAMWFKKIYIQLYNLLAYHSSSPNAYMSTILTNYNRLIYTLMPPFVCYLSYVYFIFPY